MPPKPANRGGEGSGSVGPPGRALDHRPRRRQPRPLRDLPVGRLDPAPALSAAGRSPAIATPMPWDRVHWFWGDERFVPWDHPDSNYRMAREAMLAHVPAPAAEHPRHRDRPAIRRRPPRAYERALKSYYGAETPRSRRARCSTSSCWVWGRTAIPHRCFRARASSRSAQRWVAEIVGAKPEGADHLDLPGARKQPPYRFSGRGRRQARAVWRGSLAGDPELPAARLRPVGELVWFVDEAGAARTR